MKRWLRELVASFGLKCGDLTIIACTDEYLLEINQKYLCHDYYTDIITFDYSDESVVSGDLLISLDRIKENAALNLVDFNTELYRVIAHGVLHLCGLKDKSSKDVKLMRNAEEAALESLNNLIINK